VTGRGMLDYRDNNMGPGGVAAFSGHVFLAELCHGSSHVCLAELMLSQNNLGVHGALTLGKALRCMPCLSLLHIANTQV